MSISQATKNDQPLFEIPRWIPLLSILLQFVVGGIRFSDGRILLAIAKGRGIEDPIFQDPITQYIWESPLKIWLLRSFPLEDFSRLGILFFCLGLLPIIGLVWPIRSKFYILTAGLVILTPSLKISLQNLGVGDGFTSFLTVLIVASLSFPILASAMLFILGLWHPGQVLFIAASVLLGAWSCGLYSPLSEISQNSRERSHAQGSFQLLIALSAISLAASKMVLRIYNNNLGFEYLDRLGYMKQKLAEILPGNITHAPLALFFPFLYASAVFLMGKNGIIKPYISYVILAWIALISFISLATTDVSRVSILCLSPIVILFFQSFAFKTLALPSSLNLFSRKILVFLALTPSVIPLYSWSGVDFSLWPDLIADLCKYGVKCLN